MGVRLEKNKREMKCTVTEGRKKTKEEEHCGSSEFLADLKRQFGTVDALLFPFSFFAAVNLHFIAFDAIKKERDFKGGASLSDGLSSPEKRNFSL